MVHNSNKLIVLCYNWNLSKQSVFGPAIQETRFFFSQNSFFEGQQKEKISLYVGSRMKTFAFENSTTRNFLGNKERAPPGLVLNAQLTWRMHIKPNSRWKAILLPSLICPREKIFAFITSHFLGAHFLNKTIWKDLQTSS